MYMCFHYLWCIPLLPCYWLPAPAKCLPKLCMLMNHTRRLRCSCRNLWNDLNNILEYISPSGIVHCANVHTDTRIVAKAGIVGNR